jgi:hypothetical protein
MINTTGVIAANVSFMIEACLREDDDGGVFMGDEEGKESILEQFPP